MVKEKLCDVNLRLPHLAAWVSEHTHTHINYTKLMFLIILFPKCLDTTILFMPSMNFSAVYLIQTDS